MNPEDIKVGETYNVRVKVDSMDVDASWCLLIDESGKGNRVQKFYKWMLYAFSPIPTPKYDPRRKFRKGDIVRLREYNGRKPYDFWHKQTIKHFGAKLDTVYEDEKEDSGNVDIFQDAPIDELMVRVHASHLELVTPVEELEPYSVHESKVVQGFDIVRDKLCVMSFPSGAKESGWYYSRLEAKEAAEAECKRLNAEYRKEQK